MDGTRLTCCLALACCAIQSIQQTQQGYVGMWVGGTRAALWAVPEAARRSFDALLAETVSAPQIKGTVCG